MVLRKTPEERFWERVDRRGSDECWPWKGYVVISNEGKSRYGQFWNGERTVYAHRFAYELLVGPIPKGLTIDHVKARGCTSTLCMNPAHMEPVTLKVNIMRSDSACAVHAKKTHCFRGHPFDDTNTYVRQKGGRVCRICAAKGDKVWHQAHKTKVSQ